MNKLIKEQTFPPRRPRLRPGEVWASCIREIGLKDPANS